MHQVAAFFVNLGLLAICAQSLITDLPVSNGPIPPIDPKSIQFGKTGLGQFEHPGIWHTHDDLERIRVGVANEQDPWITAYGQFKDDEYSLANYTMQGPRAVLSRGLVSNYSTFSADVRAAWQNALMWYITRDQAHWDRATTILDAWGSNLTSVVGTDRSLLVALEGQLFVNAAEIMRWEGNWTEAGARWQGGTGFSTQLYWLFARQSIIVGQANYGMASISALLSFAVYLEDASLYNYALSMYQNDLCAGLYGNWDVATGQSAESGRDQGHAQIGIGWAATAARTVQSQGGDLYGLEDNLLLKAAEYSAKFNLNSTVPYDPKFSRCEAVLVNGPWQNISQENKGVTRPIWDIVYYQYSTHRGLAAPWTTKAKEVHGPEYNVSSADESSWGDLVWSY
ncbi:hypothetical protein LQW54_009351 [Pestalotiopsis sp. IQ-011]